MGYEERAVDHIRVWSADGQSDSDKHQRNQRSHERAEHTQTVAYAPGLEVLASAGVLLGAVDGAAVGADEPPKKEKGFALVGKVLEVVEVGGGAVLRGPPKLKGPPVCVVCVHVCYVNCVLCVLCV